MNSKASVAAVGLLLLGAILVAGCTSSLNQQATSQPTLIQTSPTPTVTPRATAGPSDVAAYFEGLLKQQMGFSIVQPLTHRINTVGNDVYTGTVARGTLTSTVAVETCQNVHDTQLRGQDYINAFKADGYVTRDDKTDYWSGAKGTYEAEVIVDTTDMYVMAFESI